VPGRIRQLVADPDAFRRHVADIRREWVYNLGRSGPAGAEAIARIAREAGEARRGRG
jgi:hypothetical protein